MIYLIAGSGLSLCSRERHRTPFWWHRAVPCPAWPQGRQKPHNLDRFCQVLSLACVAGGSSALAQKVGVILVRVAVGSGCPLEALCRLPVALAAPSFAPGPGFWKKIWGDGVRRRVQESGDVFWTVRMAYTAPRIKFGVSQVVLLLALVHGASWLQTMRSPGWTI